MDPPRCNRYARTNTFTAKRRGGTAVKERAACALSLFSVLASLARVIRGCSGCRDGGYTRSRPAERPCGLDPNGLSDQQGIPAHTRMDNPAGRTRPGRTGHHPPLLFGLPRPANEQRPLPRQTLLHPGVSTESWGGRHQQPVWYQRFCQRLFFAADYLFSAMEKGPNVMLQSAAAIHAKPPISCDCDQARPARPGTYYVVATVPKPWPVYLPNGPTA